MLVSQLERNIREFDWSPQLGFVQIRSILKENVGLSKYLLSTWGGGGDSVVIISISNVINLFLQFKIIYN